MKKHTLQALVIALVSVVTIASVPVEARAAVLTEDYYRDSNITFFGRDVASCAGGGGGGPANIGVDKGFSLGSGSKERRVNLVKALMRDFGLSGQQAAGIVGNFMQESGGVHLPPDVNEGGRAGPPSFSGGYGWAQWTGSRQETFIGFAVNKGYMKSKSVRAKDDANYAYLKHELNTGYKSTITELKKTNNPIDAAVSFHQTFEKSADTRAQIGERGTSAQQVFRELGGGGAANSSVASISNDGCGSGANGTIVGDTAFPLKTTKKEMDNKNPGMFKGGNTSKSGHPYTAFDILADPGTPVLAFMSGTVTLVTTDRCPGRMISIYNKKEDITVSYLHLNTNQGTHVKDNAKVSLGDKVGVVGPPSAGCGTPHLHIDAAKGKSRPGCSRLNCPRSNASQFVDIGPQLFKTYKALP